MNPKLQTVDNIWNELLDIPDIHNPDTFIAIYDKLKDLFAFAPEITRCTKCTSDLDNCTNCISGVAIVSCKASNVIQDTNTKDEYEDTVRDDYKRAVGISETGKWKSSYE